LRNVEYAGIRGFVESLLFYEYFDIGLSILFESIYVIMDPNSYLLSHIEQGKNIRLSVLTPS